ncbi:MAG: tRNA lysidine(34) synthetase TilS [Propionibacteriaceae bacterium]|nr:tRNA lysidine(34) synthetase TilS [Propionibacteriaceae bacterium]
MARRALSPTCLALVQALEASIPVALAHLGLHRCRIGLSGGADSLALTAAAAWARDHRHGPLAQVEFTARIIDHSLQEGSRHAATMAAQASEDLAVRADIVPVSVEVSGQGVEAAARHARYSALEQGEDALILLGHTMDDQAETVLLGLARGSGTRSLAGMPPQRGRLLRPFLHLRRSDTEQACCDWGLSWWEDPMNDSETFARCRVRKVMPILEEALGPGITQSLARSADLCRQDADFIEGESHKVGLDPSATTLSIRVLEELHPALRHRILLQWLRYVGDDAVTKEHVLAVDSLITQWRGQKSICVPSGSVVRQSDELVLNSSDRDHLL